MAFLELFRDGVGRDILDLIKTMKWQDYLDIAVVAVIIYYAIRLVKETRAMQLVKSIGVVLAVYLLAIVFSMSTLKFLLGKVLDYGLVVLVVLFQPEIRRALEKIGRSKLADIGKLGTTGRDEEETKRLIEILIESVMDLSSRNEGALIVIERETRLGDIISTGTVIDAHASPELIANIFFKNSPLHDGAMVIRKNNIYAAGCYLPLSNSYGINRELGTRHRAGLGISEVSDAVTVIVSEERGTISMTMDSRIQSNLSLQNLRKRLEMALLPEESEPKKRRIFGLGGKDNAGK